MPAGETHKSKTKSSERKSSGWRGGWMLLGMVEKKLQRAGMCVELYRRRSPWTLLSRNNIQIQPAQTPWLSPCLVFPSTPGGLWIPDSKDLSNGLRRSWERAQIQQVLRRTDNKKLRHVTTAFVHAVVPGDGHETMSWNPCQTRKPEWD